MHSITYGVDQHRRPEVIAKAKIPLQKDTRPLYPVLLGTGSLVRNGLVLSYLGQDALSCPTWDRMLCPVLRGTGCLVLSYLGQNALSGMALAQSLVGQAALFIKHSVKDISSAAPANANTLWQS